MNKSKTNDDPYYDIEEYWDESQLITDDDYDILCDKIDNGETITDEEYERILEYEAYVDDVILAMHKSLSPTTLDKISQTIMAHKHASQQS